MAHIVVAGSVNLDRVWWLEAPLQSGARLSYAHRQLRLGGGGFNTAVALRTLGHDVSIVASLADDKAGRACRRALEQFIARINSQ